MQGTFGYEVDPTSKIFHCLDPNGLYSLPETGVTSWASSPSSPAFRSGEDCRTFILTLRGLIGASRLISHGSSYSHGSSLLQQTQVSWLPLPVLQKECNDTLLLFFCFFFSNDFSICVFFSKLSAFFVEGLLRVFSLIVEMPMFVFRFVNAPDA